MKTITSRHNPLVRLAREARDGKADGLIFVEGLRLCEEAAGAGIPIEAVLFSESLAKDSRARRLLESFDGTEATLARVGDGIINSLADTKTPQGVVVLARRPPSDASMLEGAAGVIPLIVIVHGVGNPSNAGAMLRVAEAAGASGVVATRRTTDLFSPKSLRGAMGSAFRIPIWAGAEFGEVTKWCGARGITTVSTSLDARLSHAEWDWTRPSAVIMGAEASGLGREESRSADASVRIPMRPPVESLNVAVALSVVLYEAARQRGSF